MLLDPPGWHRLWQREAPHGPYVRAVAQALADRGIPPGIVRADVDLRAYHQTDRHDRIYMILAWDVSRTGARGGVRLTWDDDTGWSYAKLGAGIHDVLLEAPVTPCTASSPAQRMSLTWPKDSCTTGAPPRASTARSGTRRTRCGRRARLSAATECVDLRPALPPTAPRHQST